ncbi:MAG: cobyric acid synthase [Lachnospirales bacterium]
MVIMIQGTMSNVGKSVVCAGILRALKRRGYSVAPFKSQNMALNSYITKDGFEIGRAQAVQALASGIEPDVNMNPILLKPNSDTGSQVIVMGKPIGNMSAKDYYKYKKNLVPYILEAYNNLKEKYDIVVIEGAGSPAEINLKNDDIVNMGMAEMADSPVILVGDIDRGGVFAQLYGTISLLTPSERDRIKGLVINKFRGDKSILESGLNMLRAKCGKDILGVLPYTNFDIEDEDSLSDRFENNKISEIDIAVIKLPRISNFTDFIPLENFGLRYVTKPQDLGTPDLIIIPGTKNTVLDMIWLRESGMESAILKHKDNSLIMGICGGYQILGNTINDEAEGNINAMGLLDCDTIIKKDKKTTQTKGKILSDFLKDSTYYGYEIHMGKTYIKNAKAFDTNGGAISGNIFGTYVHGIFDEGNFRENLINYIAKKKGITLDKNFISFDEYRNKQFDILADMIEENLDISRLIEIMKNNKKEPEISYVEPKNIEKRSMEIIESELFYNIPTENLDVVKRAIHTTADFDYGENLYFTKDAVKIAREALKNGANIITDTNMAKSGINKNALKKLGGEVYCFMADSDVAEKANKLGTTRATVSMEKAVELGDNNIFAIGNAPTALIKLKELIDNGKIKPALIIAVPVGFVNVVEAKNLIEKTNIPLIVARGRKGGSNLAAAICNALIYGIDR